MGILIGKFKPSTWGPLVTSGFPSWTLELEYHHQQTSNCPPGNNGLPSSSLKRKDVIPPLMNDAPRQKKWVTPWGCQGVKVTYPQIQGNMEDLQAKKNETINLST